MKQAFLLLVLCACGDRFPKGFLFGTAIAGFQAEMGCPTLAAAQCEDRGSDWYQWITRPELLADPSTHLAGTPPSGGPGLFELYAQDIARAAAELHSNALRLSIEWSRVFPSSTIGVSDLRSVASSAALAYYHAVFAAMKALGLRPLVTLDHYTLPVWLHEGAACHAPSDARTNPPGVSLRWAEAKAVYAALVHAHARMYDAVKAAAPGAQVGIVYNLQAVSPKNPSSSADVKAAGDLDYLMNRVFLNAVARGDFDAGLNGSAAHSPDLAGRLDFLGVNYYLRAIAESAGGPLFADQTPYITFNPLLCNGRPTRAELVKSSTPQSRLRNRFTSPRPVSGMRRTPAQPRILREPCVSH